MKPTHADIWRLIGFALLAGAAAAVLATITGAAQAAETHGAITLSHWLAGAAC